MKEVALDGIIIDNSNTAEDFIKYQDKKSLKIFRGYMDQREIFIVQFPSSEKYQDYKKFSEGNLQPTFLTQSLINNFEMVSIDYFLESIKTQYYTTSSGCEDF